MCSVIKDEINSKLSILFRPISLDYVIIMISKLINFPRGLAAYDLLLASQLQLLVGGTFSFQIASNWTKI